MITIKPHSLVGTPSKTVWSQALSFERSGVSAGVLLRMTNTLESDLLELSSVGGAFLQKTTKKHSPSKHRFFNRDREWSLNQSLRRKKEKCHKLFRLSQ